MSKRLPRRSAETELLERLEREQLEPLSADEAGAERTARLSPEQVAEQSSALKQLREAIPRYPSLSLAPLKDDGGRIGFAATLIDDREALVIRAFIVSGFIGRCGDELAILEIRVKPRTPGPLNSTALRVVARDAAKILARVRAEAEAGPEWLPVLERLGLYVPTDEEEQQVRALADLTETLPLKRGRIGYPDDHYREVAQAYLDLHKQGVGRGILVKLAEHESERLGRTISRATVRDWVSGATKRGFLMPGKQGRAGRDAGPNLYRKEK